MSCEPTHQFFAGRHAAADAHAQLHVFIVKALRGVARGLNLLGPGSHSEGKRRESLFM